MYSDQAFWGYLDTCSTFFVVYKKGLIHKNFEFLGIEKEYDKKTQLRSWFRLQTRS